MRDQILVHCQLGSLPFYLIIYHVQYVWKSGESVNLDLWTCEVISSTAYPELWF